MWLRRALTLSLLLALAARPTRAETTPPSASYQEVDTIFSKHCLDCHGTVDPEARLVLENYDGLVKGGENGPVLKPGKSAESLLIQLVEGSAVIDGKKKIMPPGKRAKLAGEEIQALKSWVDAGAAAPPKGVNLARDLVVPRIKPRGAPRSPVNAVAVDPSGKWAALARYGEVDLVSTEEQEVVRVLTGLRGNVNAVVFSPSGRELFAASGDSALLGEVKEFRIPDGQLMKTIQGHRDSIYAVAVSPDGATLATGSYDQKIKLWDIARGAELRTLSGHNGAVFGLSFRRDGKVLASASSDRTVKLWDPATGGRLDTLSQSTKDLYAVSFSPDGARLAAAGADNRIRLWDITDRARETAPPVVSRFAHEGAILRLAFSSDGKWIVTSSQDLTLKLWDATTVEEKRVFESQPDWPSGIAFAEENKTVMVGRLDGTYSFYDVQKGSVVKPPGPALTGVEPRGVQSGIKTRVLVSGRRLGRLTRAKASDNKLQVKLDGSLEGDERAWLEVEPSAKLAPGAYKLAVVSDRGESDWLALWVDNLPQLTMGGSNEARIEAPSLPAVVWGTIAKPGQSKTIEFHAQSGETLSFDSETKVVGSAARLNLALEDANGRLLAHAGGFVSGNAPLLSYTFKDAGVYRLVVTEALLEGSELYFFRVAIGAFPCVTGFFPLGVAAGATTRVELTGYNLPKDSVFNLDASAAGEIDFPVDPNIYRSRSLPKLLVTRNREISESEPNDTPEQANEIAQPCVVNGRLWTRNQASDFDVFKFSAKKGERLILETVAAQRGSPADTKIEVLYPNGKPVHRALLQATRDSHVTFGGIDSNSNDVRPENANEMELNQFLYMNGEVCKLFRAPRGPDSGWMFYTMGGKRRDYFDTSARVHPDDEACYIVEPRPPGSKPLANGLPTFMVDYVNDDEEERRLGTDSLLHFTAPTDGSYLVKVSDSRGFQGEEFAYRLIVRDAAPDFKVTIDGANPTVAPGSGKSFSVKAERIDGFEGEIKVEFSGLPPGFLVSSPLVIQAGQLEAEGVVYALPEARWPDDKHPMESKASASAMIDGVPVSVALDGLGQIKRGETPKARVALGPDGPSPLADRPGARAPAEITIAPGETVPARIKVWRDGFEELLTFSVENLPHGVIVDNIGLNGVLIPKGQDERTIFISAAKWVPETDRLCYAVEDQAGRQTSAPVLLHVRKKSGMKTAAAVARK